MLVINPNANTGVTDGIRAAVQGLAGPTRPIEVVGLEGTPYGIESQRDVDAVAGPLAERIAAESDRYDAFVIACFSDPGLHAAREVTAKPVLGIAQSGVLTAMALGSRVGVISILPGSIPRHWRAYRAMGVSEGVVGDHAVGASVAELADETAMGDRMLSVGRDLREACGADVLVLGCAGMAKYRTPLEAELGVPVVDPTQAAVGLAQTSASLGLLTR